MDAGWAAVWVAIGGIVASVALVYLADRWKAKELSYIVYDLTHPVSVLPGHSERVTILYQDKPVSAVTTLKVTFFNSGGVAIEPEDFSEPIKITFPEGSKVLAAQHGGRIPSWLAPKAEYADNWLRFEPLMLNPGDQFDIEVQVGDWTGTAHVTAHIRNAKFTKRPKPHVGLDRFIGEAFFYVSALATGLGISLARSGQQYTSTAFLVMGGLYLGAAIAYHFHNKKAVTACLVLSVAAGAYALLGWP